MRTWPWALLGLLVLATGCGERASPHPSLIETVNAVRVNGAAVSVAPPRQLLLASGDVIDVEPGAVARLLYADGTRVLLVGRKDLPARLKLEPRGSETARVLLKLLGGTLSFLVPPKRPEQRQYDIEALSTLTMVRGTTGRIVSTPAADHVALSDGHVDVRRLDGGEQTAIAALEELVAAAASKFVKRPYDPTAPGELDLYDTKIDRTRHGF